MFCTIYMLAPAKLAAQADVVSAQQQTIEDQKSRMDEQSSAMSAQQKTMQDQQARLDQIVGVRSEIIEALKQEFDDTDLGVKIDPQTGSIAFDSSIMFDYDKSDLKQKGKGFLTEFLPRYLSIILSEKFRPYISEIIIEGHTDTSGSYLFNLELSQQRALSVANYFLQEGNSELGIDEDELRKLVTANGRSYSDPVYNEDGTVNMDASRRVEFKFRLKDDEMISEMIKILVENPDLEVQTEKTN